MYDHLECVLFCPLGGSIASNVLGLQAAYSVYVSVY